MLTRLKLHRFRYIKPGTELRFTDRFNVLLGKNGTGKTTLLQLISMVLRSDFSALRDEEFDIEYEFAHALGTGSVRFQNKRRSPLPDLTTSASRGGGKVRQHHPHVVFKLHAKRRGSEHDYEVVIDGITMQWRKDGSAWEGNAAVNAFEGSLFATVAVTTPIPDAPTPDWNFILLDFNLTASQAYRFDESLGTFDSITDANRLPVVGGVPPISLEMSFNEADWSWARGSFVPSDYKPMRPEPGQSSTAVDLPTNASLAKFPALSSIKTMSMSFAVEGSRGQPDDVWWTFGRAEFLFSNAKGSVFNHNLLSYGQKRLLAFLYYLDANPQYVVADELVNGMHHDWIRACLDEIGDRQAFLTSQNPLLLDYLPLESVEQVERSFIQCRSEVIDDETVISWSNLAAEDAAELFADYKVGVQPVGEILRARGLW